VGSYFIAPRYNRCWIISVIVVVTYLFVMHITRFFHYLVIMWVYQQTKSTYMNIMLLVFNP